MRLRLGAWDLFRKEKMRNRPFFCRLVAVAASVLMLACAASYAKPAYKFANFSGDFNGAKKAGYDGVQLNHGRKSMEDSGGYTKEQIADLKKKMKETGLPSTHIHTFVSRPVIFFSTMIVLQGIAVCEAWTLTRNKSISFKILQKAG